MHGVPNPLLKYRYIAQTKPSTVQSPSALFDFQTEAANFNIVGVTLVCSVLVQHHAQCDAMTTIFYLLLGIHGYFNF
jgi:hypothetical protein